jgi:Flp pilus assembly protein TadG
MAATSRASPNRDRSRDTDGGMVTIEAAVALCAFVTVLAMVLAGVSMVLDQIRCVDAAREAARLVARGEQNRAADAVRQIGPPRATLSITTNGDEITVVVQDPAGGGLLPGVHVRGEAYAIQEPTDPDSTNTGPTTGGGDPTAAGPVNDARTKSGPTGRAEGHPPDLTRPGAKSPTDGGRRQAPVQDRPVQDRWVDPPPDTGPGRSSRPTEGDGR